MKPKLSTLKEELWTQREVIEFLRVAPSSFFAAERYNWLRSRAIKDGTRRKYRMSDVFAFISHLQEGGV